MFRFINFILILMAIHISAISNEIIPEIEKETQEELLCALQILEQQPQSIDSYEEGRLYLKIDRIIIANNGLFLCNEASYIYLPAIHATARGCYLRIPSDTNFWRNYYKCSNPKCGRKFLGGMGPTEPCPFCGSVAHKI